MNAPDLPLRIIVVEPPAGVVFALQRGRSELQGPTGASAGALWFDFSVRVRLDANAKAVSVLGPFCQGTAAKRFVYVTSGSYAGDAHSCWNRRAKVPLGGLTSELVARLQHSTESILAGRIAGTSRDGGPACASVPLLDPGWSIIDAR